MNAVIVRADARHLPLPDASVDLIVTSPPYFGLRSYTDTVKCLKCIDMERDGRDPRQAWPDYDAHFRRDHVQHYGGQIGSEATPAAYVAALLDCTREWMRVLKPSGSMFVNLGDKYSTTMHSYNYRDPGTYTRKTPQPDGEWSKTGWKGQPNVQPAPQDPGLPPKCLLGMPWRYALGCIDDLGLILRAEIIWAKPNGLPESVTDRVRRSHEQVFHFTRQPRYYSAVDEVREPQTGTSHVQASRTMHSGNGLTHRVGGTDGTSYNPLGKLPGSVWEIPSQPLTVPAALGVDHFAAFPMELPRRIIAGWSPPGICVACGEGRRPVMDRQVVPLSVKNVPGRSLGMRDSSRGDAAMTCSGQEMARWKAAHPDRITGYACACPQPDAPTRPARVADPFGGTGTTALVASVLGRDGFSFDRSADYCRLARWRVTDPGERARAMQVPKPPAVMDGQDTLFAV